MDIILGVAVRMGTAMVLIGSATSLAKVLNRYWPDSKFKRFMYTDWSARRRERDRLAKAHEATLRELIRDRQ